MIKGKIDSYFFKEGLKTALLFLGCFYFLYILIDYASHTKSLNQASLPFYYVIFYYCFQFLKRAEILLPLAFLISLVKVLTQASARNEIVALVTNGISLKTVTKPLFLLGLFISIILLGNFQFLYPKAVSYLNHFEERFFKDKEKAEESIVHVIELEDRSVLLYQRYDSLSKAFFDVYWFQSPERFTHIKWLFPLEKVPYGKFVDEFTYTIEGVIKKQSLEKIPFSHMHFDPTTLFSAVHPPRDQSLVSLIKNSSFKSPFSKIPDREAHLQSHLLYKLWMGFTPLLIFLGITPFCLSFQRQFPLFMIYAGSLISMIGYFTWMGASLIIAESQLITPILAISLVPLMILIISSYRYGKL